MMIDCDVCVVRGLSCDDCVVTVLLGEPPADRRGTSRRAIDLDLQERAAIAVLADSGLVPPLRLVAAARSDSGPQGRPSQRSQQYRRQPDDERRTAI